MTDKPHGSWGDSDAQLTRWALGILAGVAVSTLAAYATNGGIPMMLFALAASTSAMCVVAVVGTLRLRRRALGASWRGVAIALASIPLQLAIVAVTAAVAQLLGL